MADLVENVLIITEKVESGGLVVSSQGHTLPLIRTPTDSALCNQEQKHHVNYDEHENDNIDGPVADTTTDWLPISVINRLPDSNGHEIRRAKSTVTSEISETFEEYPQSTPEPNDSNIFQIALGVTEP